MYFGFEEIRINTSNKNGVEISGGWMIIWTKPKKSTHLRDTVFRFAALSGTDK
jgi:hypothetical protein